MKNKNLEKQHLLYNKVLAAIGEILSGWNITGRQLPQIFWSKWSHIKYDTPHTSDHTSDHKYLYLYTSQFVHVCWSVLLKLTGDWERAVQTSGDCETSDRQDRVNIRLQDCRTNKDWGLTFSTLVRIWRRVMSWLTLNCRHRLLFSSSWAEWARAAEDSMLGGYIENLNRTNINRNILESIIFHQIFWFSAVKKWLNKATDWQQIVVSVPAADKLPEFRRTKNDQLLRVVPDALHLVGLQQAPVVLHHHLEQVLQEVVGCDSAEVPL